MIKKIIDNKCLEINFHPIVSVRNKTIFAFEALTRCTFEGKIISPVELFKMAKKSNLTISLDNLTREMAIRKFSKYYKENNDLILFLNFESEVINSFEKDNFKDEFIHIIKELKIPFKNFVLEIKEDKIKSNEVLKNFCRKYKSLGFSIALDDFGTGSSNFNRINLINPDIIKIDKSLFDNIYSNQVNKEIVKSISKMSHNLGIRVIAEGVEKADEICFSMKSNVNLFQGFYFDKPKDSFTSIDFKNIVQKTKEIGELFRNKTIASINKKRENIKLYNKIAKSMLEKVDDISKNFDILEKEFLKYENIEAIYLIDKESSKQINDTLIKNIKNDMFKPTKHGHVHYLKEYYYITVESREGIFLSSKYISYASGNVCKTFAKKFEVDKKSYILCLDIVVE